MKAHDGSEFEERSGQKAAKKTYEKPQLQVYGDLSETTRALMGSMANDGAAHANKHFTS